MAGPAYIDAFRFIKIQPDDVTVTADAVNDTLTLVAGAGISLVANTTNDQITIVNSGQGLANLNDVLLLGNTSTQTMTVAGITAGNVVLSASNINTGDNSAISVTPALTTESTFTAGAGIVTQGHIIPDTNVIYDLGSPTNRFRDLYLSGASIKLGDVTITSTGTTLNLPVGTTIENVVIPTSLDGLTDVDVTTTPPTAGQTLKWDGTNWVPGIDVTVGGAGVDADYFDGQDSPFYLNYNNFTNTPDLTVYAPKANPTFTGTVSGITKSMVGLGNVDNTADANKNVLYATTAGSALASDVYAWAKAATKPTYTASEVGLGNVLNVAQEPAITAGTTAQYWRGDKTWQTLDSSAVGLGNVTNESKTTMFTSPTFTGTPAAPTATSGTNTTQIATTAFVQTAVSNLVNAAPATLDTLNELATALGNDPNFATTVSTSIGTKAPINNPTFTGTVSGITKSMVGLGNVDNTADANKNVLYAATAGSAPASDVYAWAKAATKPTYTASEVGLGNVLNVAQEPAITAGTTAQYWRGDKTWQTLDSSAVGLGNVTNESKATMFTSPTFTGTVSGITKAMVGLGNVDNTADANKSVNYAATAGSAPASDVYAWAKAATKPTYTASEVGLGNVTNESKATMFTSPTFTGIATVPTVLFAANGFSITQSGTKIVFSYNGIAVFSIDSLGNVIAKADITGFGTP